jgi:hypothetical protein
MENGMMGYHGQHDRSATNVPARTMKQNVNHCLVVRQLLSARKVLALPSADDPAGHVAAVLALYHPVLVALERVRESCGEC